MNTDPPLDTPLVFIKAPETVFKEYDSSDSDSSVVEYSHRGSSMRNVLQLDSDDDDEDIDPSKKGEYSHRGANARDALPSDSDDDDTPEKREHSHRGANTGDELPSDFDDDDVFSEKLESLAAINLDSRTPLTPERDDEDVEMNERRKNRRRNAKRKITVWVTTPIDASDTEEHPKRPTRRAPSNHLKDNVMNEGRLHVRRNPNRSTRTTSSNKLKSPSHPYTTCFVSRGRDAHPEMNTPKDSPTPVLPKKTIASESAMLPKNTIVSESARGNLQRDKPRIVTRSTKISTDSESEVSDVGPAHGLRSKRTVSLPRNDEKLKNGKSPKKQKKPNTCETPRTLRSSTSRTRNKSARQMSSVAKKLAKVKLKSDEETSPRTSKTPKSFTITVPRCDNTKASPSFLRRHSTRTKRPVTAFTDQPSQVRSSARVSQSVHPRDVKSDTDTCDNTDGSPSLIRRRSKRTTRSVVACTDRSSRVKSSVSQSVAHRDVKSHTNTGQSTPSSRSKRSTKTPVSCRKRIVYDSDVDRCGGDAVDDVPSPNELEDSSDDFVPDPSSSSEDEKNSDDIFYPHDRRSQGSKTSATPRILRTPRTLKVNVNTLTASLPSRTTRLSTPTTPKDRAMRALHISSVPESLPCRQQEFETIYNFLRKKIKGTDGGFMYVYGIPGAGKTATLERVIKRLEIESSKKKLDKFTFVDINGMHLKQPKDIYCQILQKLDKLSMSAPKAKSVLEQKFQTVFTKQPIVLLIDEFDMLFNRTLSVVDTLLDWVDQSKLIIVGIANSKDLIEEIDRSSTKSRMLRERLHDVQFKTYTYQQLQEIIGDRLKEHNVFTRDAIELLARKSALSGDVRLALNLCRRVLAEAGDGDAQKAIDAPTVVHLLEKIHKDPKIEFIRSLATQDRMLLRALCDVTLISGLPTCSLAKNFYAQYKAVCLMNGVLVRDEFSLFRNLRQLERYALITLHESDCDIHTEIGLGNNLDLVQIALQPERVI